MPLLLLPQLSNTVTASFNTVSISIVAFAFTFTLVFALVFAIVDTLALMFGWLVLLLHYNGSHCAVMELTLKFLFTVENKLLSLE